MADTTGAATDNARVRRIVITRPEPDATRWVQALTDRGWVAEALPLLRIDEPALAHDRESLAHWRRAWPSQDALMFVSAAAVQRFFADTVDPGPGHARFWAPGPGTARALLQALWPLGIGEERIDMPPREAAQFDSEHLWPVVAQQMGPERRLLVVRGASGAGDPGALPGQGREWLIDQCRNAGAEVQACVAYQRRIADLGEAERAQAQAASGAGHVWLISSSEALQALQGLWPAGLAATALVTHPRIAEAARVFGFARVLQARPTLADVMRALESVACPS